MTPKLDWGFKLTATAPVCLKAVELLYEKFGSEGVTRIECQDALSCCKNDVVAAEKYLKSPSAGKQKITKLGHGDIKGLYSRTTGNGV